MRTTFVLVALLGIASAAPAVSAAHDPAKYAYDIPDPRGDVVQVASNGSEVVVSRPGVDIVRLRSALQGDEVRVTLTFAEAPPAEDLRVLLTSGVTVIDWTTADGTDDATVEHEGRDIVLTFANPQVLDPQTFQPKPAECLAIEAQVTHDPEGTDDATAQGWMDRVGTTPSWCTEGVVADGLTGTCPASRIPAGVALEGSWTDAAGDVTMGFPAETVDMPESDVRGFRAKLVDGRVVLELDVARMPFHETVDITLHFAEPDVGDFASGHHLLITDFLTPSGVRMATPFDETPEPFFVTGERRADGVTYSFCASVIPPEALCVQYVARVAFREPSFGSDRLDGGAERCAGKRGAAADDGAAEEDGATGGPGPSPPDSGDGTAAPTTTSRDEEADDTSTPGPGALVAALALALVAFVTRRRQA